MKIRKGRADDLDALYAIALATGDNGRDASGLYDDPQMVGHLYAAPYLMVEGGFCFVAEDDEGVCGYIVGTADTLAFEQALERSWWPGLRERYRAPEVERRAEWTADEAKAHQIHHPVAAPADVVAGYPAHLHMNLYPRARGRGLGRGLLETALQHLADEAVPGVFVGAGWSDVGGAAFWQASGFAVLCQGGEAGRVVYLGRAVA